MHPDVGQSGWHPTLSGPIRLHSKCNPVWPPVVPNLRRWNWGPGCQNVGSSHTEPEEVLGGVGNTIFNDLIAWLVEYEPKVGVCDLVTGLNQLETPGELVRLIGSRFSNTMACSFFPNCDTSGMCSQNTASAH